MPTSNPALNDSALARVVPPEHLRSGWAAPTYVPPTPDTVSPWNPAPPTAPPTATPAGTMTVGGAVTATAVLLVQLCASGFIGWHSVTANPDGSAQLPGWTIVALFVALGDAVATVLRPGWARVTAPLYAIVEGTVVGAISSVYERTYDGIVLNAVVATVGVLAIMLFLHATRIIKVTDKLRMGIVMATGAIMLMYVFDLVLRLFGADVPFVHDSSGIGILLSVGIVVVASLNLQHDFDLVERAVAARAPKQTEWYAAFGLIVTLVWLYLELLRLLAKLQRR
jgi:uncharacterized YccA/Bax inhibitor family protein